jgi:NADH-quinone oxidoreductase subunit N
VAGGHWLLLALLIVGTGLGIYYYLRVIYEMSRAVDDRVAVRVASSSATRALGLQAVALGLIAAILFLGILPEVLMHYLSGVL